MPHPNGPTPPFQPPPSTTAAADGDAKRRPVCAAHWLFGTILLLALALPGCADKSVKTDIPPAEMKAALKELYLVQQRLILTEPNPEKRDSLASVRYQQVLHRQGFDPAHFREAYAAYQQRPKQLKQLTEELLEEITMEAKVLEDSLRQAGHHEALQARVKHQLKGFRERLKP